MNAGADLADELTRAIRTLLREHARLAEDVDAIGDQADLYEAGLTSHASVTLMLALEERFDVEFPERMLRRGSFATIAAIRAGLVELPGRAHERSRVSSGSADTARRSVPTSPAPRQPPVDRDGRFPHEAIDALREERMLGALRSDASSAVAARRSRTWRRPARCSDESCASTAMIFAMHQIEVACLVRHAAVGAVLPRLSRRARREHAVADRVGDVRDWRRRRPAPQRLRGRTRRAAHPRHESRRRSSRTATRPTTSC